MSYPRVPSTACPTTGSIDVRSIAPAGAKETFTSPKPKSTDPLITSTAAVPAPAPCACTVPANCSPSAFARLKSIKQYPAPLSRLNQSGSDPFTLTRSSIRLLADSNGTTTRLWSRWVQVITGLWLSCPATISATDKNAGTARQNSKHFLIARASRQGSPFPSPENIVSAVGPRGLEHP